ncbi:MAG: hypothetical protein IJW12_01730 [Opitutales bacterium]|nr:hypothetical protein [Opitutales bacterium]
MKSPIPKLFLLGAIALSVSGAAVPADAMNITFVGDSITQGGSFLAGNVASYRYSLFKHFVDNDITYAPMGTTVGAAKNVDVSALTPDYRGVKFSNVSEAAASGRSYQYGGHEAGSGYRADPDTVYPVENRGPVTIKLGQENPYTGTENTFYDGTALKTYTGATYQSLYGNEKVETLCVMIGINDLYDGNSNSDILKHVEEIVKAYQTHNPNVRVHLFELLPTAANNGTGTNNKNNYFSYNEQLRNTGNSWSTSTSTVSVDNISTGFYAENGAMVDTNAGAHPNAQGELIIAGNIARALGIGQRTAGLTRRAGTDLTSQLSFSANTAGGITAKIADTSTEFSTNSSAFSVNSEGNIVVNSALSGGNDIRYTWNSTGTAREFTVSFSVKMSDTNAANNGFGVILGNGAEAGILYVTECGILWNTTLLYGSNNISDTAHNTFDATKDFSEITVAYLDGNSGVDAGFYVWLGDQLIGESLNSIAGVNAHKDKILFGDIGSSWLTQCELSAIAFDASKAWAPSAALTTAEFSLPEPSAFSLLFGAGVVAICALRRKRR